ncbi:MAG TPA: heparinase II/III family protein [Candidatus Limnocylindrales bacterium]|nr:heparinase II/III family protein [Candidatus Limnocylindrales bacterium]
MKTCLHCLFMFFTGGMISWTFGAEPVPTPSASVIVAQVKKEHPRLLASEGDFARLRSAIVTNSTLKNWHAKIRQRADRMLSQPPSQYEIPDGLRLLATSRRVLDRVQNLALLYQLDGHQRDAERAWLELNTAAAFTNWNPRHFLDTAEMTHAFAIGYDWLYNFWSPEQRRVLREAMLEKGIRPANDIEAKETWWARARHNWNQVCNGGIGMGALALLDEAPDECGSFLAAALKSIQLPMREYAPDGAWAEGPGYWHYATSYNCVFLAALESALGTDFGLSQIEGFSQAGMFPIFSSGPTGRSFDFADAHSEVIRAPELFWLSRKFNQAAFSVYEGKVASGEPLDLLWYDPRAERPMRGDLPLDKYFRHAEVAMLRSAWDDPNALWVGFKAGDNRANHSHLDLGSFIFEALGERWAIDPGADDYNMPDYFGKQRWTYYRLRAEGHNTLVFNPGKDPDQDPAASASITRFGHDANPFAIADLSAAYARDATKVQRGIAMPGRKRVLIQDEFDTRSPAEVWWFVHTTAEVKTDGRAAVLSLHGKNLTARILSPAGATFTVMDAKPLPACPNPSVQNTNAGVRKLAIRLENVTRERIAVVLEPGLSPSNLLSIVPLAQW